MSLRNWTRCIAACAGLAVLAAACGGGAVTPSTGSSQGSAASSSSPEVASLNVAIYNGSAVSLPAWVAEQEGFFKKQDLDVHLTSVASSDAAVAALLSKSVDIMLNATEIVMETRAKGQDIKMVAGNTVRLPWILIARKDLPTKGSSFPEDMQGLIGKRIGVTALGTSSQFFAEALLRNANVDPSKVTILGVGFAATGLPALQNGTIDAYLTTDPGATVAVEVQHTAQTLVDTRKGEGGPLFSNWPYNGYEARTSDIVAKPGVFKRFNDAMAAAQSWMHDSANFDAVVSILAAQMNEPVATARLVAQSNLATFGNDLPKAGVDNVSKFLVQYRLLEQPAKYDDVVYQFK